MKASSGLIRRGFTLLELLIVIAIIGILVAVSAASYSSAQTKARNSRRMSDMKAVQNAAEQYFSNFGYYPDATSDLNTATYMPAGYPVDPKPSFSYSFAKSPSTCSGNTCTGYCACAQLENTTTGGNSNAAANDGCTGLGTAGQYFCVKNLQ